VGRLFRWPGTPGGVERLGPSMCQGFKLDHQDDDCSHELVLKLRTP
jgi:hypothetical protein